MDLKKKTPSLRTLKKTASLVNFFFFYLLGWGLLKFDFRWGGVFYYFSFAVVYLMNNTKLPALVEDEDVVGH